MPRRDDAVQFAGHFQSVVGELSGRLKKKGGDIVRVVSELAQPENAWALDEISAVCAKLFNIFHVKIGGRRSIVQVLDESGYTNYDRSIAERCVLQKGRERQAVIEVFGIENYDHDPSDAEIEAEYIKQGLKRPDVDRAVHFGDQYRDLPEDGHPIIFYLQNPVPGACGGPLVLSLWRLGADRELRWIWLVPGHRWSRGCRFAGVRE